MASRRLGTLYAGVFFYYHSYIMKILVTGGAGFIGSHVVDSYVKAGHRVVVADNFSSGKRENLAQSAGEFLSIHEIDLRDGNELRELVAQVKPDIVNHHAGQISVSVSSERPVDDAMINIIGTLNLLEAIRLEAPAAKLIYATSGGAMYGPHRDSNPHVEGAESFPLSPYGLSKHTAERYVWLYCNLYGLKATVLRYANVYGLRQDPHGEAGVCAIFTQRMTEGLPVTIYGDGSSIRDYVFVGDVARANVAALDRGEGHAFNISTGTGITTKELFDTFKEATGYKLEPLQAPLRPGELHASVLSPFKALDLLGWKHETSFKEGVAKTVEWYASAHNNAAA